MNQSQSLLRNTLKLNGSFSVLTGILVIAFGNSVPAFYDLAKGQTTLFTVLIVLFAAFVFYNAYRENISKGMVVTIIILDLLYVLVSILRLLADPYPSVAGKILIGFAAVVVADFAFFQYKGLKRVERKEALS